MKIVSVTDIDWNIVLEKWPLNVTVLMRSVNGFSRNHGKIGVPLYQNIADNLHIMKPKHRLSEAQLGIIDVFEKLRNGDSVASIDI